jgi:hypothetical protein
MPLDKIRVLSFTQDKLRCIPFDILEFTKEDQVVLPSGPEANPEDGDGIFSGNDKLFFMIVDAGDQIDKGYIKERFPNIKAVQEVEISYSKDNEKGWVYVAAFSGETTTKAPFDYIKFYPEVGIGFTPFTYHQCRLCKVDDKILPTVDVQTLLSSPAIGGVPIDVHNGSHICLTVVSALGVKMQHNEDEFDMRFRAWYDGNVINYKRSSWKIRQFFGVGTSTVVSNTVVTPFSALAYSTWYTSPYPLWAIKRIEMSFGDDLNKRALLNKNALKNEARFISASDKEGVIIDGIMSEKEKNWDSTRKSWYLLTGLPGTICMRSGYDGLLSDKARLSIEWVDSRENVGFYKNIITLDKRSRTGVFHMEWSVVPDFWNPDPNKYNWENLGLILKRKDKPLTYRIDKGEGVALEAYIHLPDIMAVKENYKY